MDLNWTRAGHSIVFQQDQNVTAPWFVPAAFAAAAFGITWARLELALPLLIAVTALDRYRFDFAGAGLRIEHFVFAGVLAAWLVKTKRGWRQLGWTRADLLLVAYLALGLVASLWF